MTDIRVVATYPTPEDRMDYIYDLEVVGFDTLVAPLYSSSSTSFYTIVSR